MSGGGFGGIRAANSAASRVRTRACDLDPAVAQAKALGARLDLDHRGAALDGRARERLARAPVEQQLVAGAADLDHEHRRLEPRRATSRFSSPSRTTHSVRGLRPPARQLARDLPPRARAWTRRSATATAASPVRRRGRSAATPSKRSPNSAAMKSVDSSPARKRRWLSSAVRKAALWPRPRM